MSGNLQMALYGAEINSRQIAALRSAGFEIVPSADLVASLTERQRACLAIIERAIDSTGVAPTVRELAVPLGLAGHSNVHRLLQGLAERGWIRLAHYRARAITILRRLPVDHAASEGEV